jgi:hypothetical protein
VYAAISVNVEVPLYDIRGLVRILLLPHSLVQEEGMP